jgi:hypothetical protein
MEKDRETDYYLGKENCQKRSLYIYIYIYQEQWKRAKREMFQGPNSIGKGHE